jgi:hypothetical protein
VADVSHALRFATAADAEAYLTAEHEQRKQVARAYGAPHVDGPLIGTFRRDDIRNALGEVVVGRPPRLHQVLDVGAV